jgi:hypothetical protein
LGGIKALSTTVVLRQIEMLQLELKLAPVCIFHFSFDGSRDSSNGAAVINFFRKNHLNFENKERLLFNEPFKFGLRKMLRVENLNRFFNHHK